MTELVLKDVNEIILHLLKNRAAAYDRSVEDEAKVILSDALQMKSQEV